MDGYTPGEQPGVGERVVKLNTNENPFPPSPMVVRAIQEIEPELLGRHPDDRDADVSLRGRYAGVSGSDVLAVQRAGAVAGCEVRGGAVGEGLFAADRRFGVR